MNGTGSLRADEGVGVGRLTVESMVGASLACILAAVAPFSVSAHSLDEGRHRRVTTGVLISFVGGSLWVQTPDGSVMCTVGNTTRVIRRVTGTTADLHSGQAVTLIGGVLHETISEIHVDDPATVPSRLVQSRHAPRLTPVTRPADGVQIRRISSHAITVRYSGGDTETYVLSNNLLVEKDLPGRQSDLMLHETVAVVSKQGNSVAQLVIILGS